MGERGSISFFLPTVYSYCRKNSSPERVTRSVGGSNVSRGQSVALTCHEISGTYIDLYNIICSHLCNLFLKYLGGGRWRKLVGGGGRWRDDIERHSD